MGSLRDGSHLKVTEHALQRWKERRPLGTAAGEEGMAPYLKTLQPLRPLSRERRRRGAEYYTGRGYVFVVRDEQVLTTYRLDLRQFEVL